ncbi:MAG: HD domain-containing protein [Chlorobiales bacterium]|nr:HD domain-containing protein [Chlorobiales bacterium]
MSENNQLIHKASDYIFELFKQTLPENCVYHNFNHSYEIAEACRKIGAGMNLANEDIEIAVLAAWFHDAGHVKTYEGHEEKSVEIAREFLQKNKYPEDKIAVIADCIMATRMPQSPKNVLEEVVCDADMMHIGGKKYFEKSELLRIEWENMLGKIYSDTDWIKLNIDFFKRHHFHTKFAQLEFNDAHNENLLELHRRLKSKLSQKEDELKKKEKKKEKESEKDREDNGRGTERYMEVYYRTSSRNHVDFSSIVDQKANIMIQTNALIFSIIISLLVRWLDELPKMVFPTFLLLGTCVSTIVFAILATRPKVTSAATTVEDVKNKKANLLFFGTFINLKLDEFEWGMKEMLNDKDYYTNSMIRDTYFLGKVLDKKYKFLRVSYDVFMVGMIISILAYGLVFIVL